MLKTLSDIQNFYKKERSLGFSTKSFAISFQLTGECNFRCSYCYEKKCPEIMDKEKAKRLIDKLFPIEDNLVWWNGFLRDTTDKDSITFDFFGGECTLEIDTMEELCQYFFDKCDEDPDRYAIRKEKFEISVETNGSLLRTPKVEAFFRKWEKHIFLGCSLDGSQNFHDSCRRFKDGRPTWEIVKNNLEWVIHEFPNLKDYKIKSTTTSESLPYLYESYLLFKKIGLAHVDSTIALGATWTKEDEQIAKEQYQLILDDLLKDPHPIDYTAFVSGTAFCNPIESSRGQFGACGSTGSGIALSSDNKLYTCIQFSHITMHEDNLEDFSIGTVENGITDKGIEIADRILESFDKTIFSNEKCKKCNTRPGCEYCPAFSYKANKDFNVMPKERCEIERIRMIYGMKYKYELEKKLWQRSNLS